MGFMDSVIADSMDLWEAAADEPFLARMGDGTLDKAMFYDYIVQDSIYLRYYLRAFAMGMFRAETLRDMQFFYSVLGFVNDSENATRLAYLKDAGLTDDDVEKIERKPVCVAYTDFLIKEALEDDSEGLLMAVMPCMLGYEYVFRKTLERNPGVTSTYFGPLVADYTRPEYGECCHIWTDYCDRVCSGADEKRRKELSDVFREASLHELRFWQMAGGRA